MPSKNEPEIREGKLAPVPVGRKVKNQKYLDMYDESYSTGRVLEVDVTAEEALRVNHAVRGYASKTGRGVTLQIQERELTDAQGNPVVLGIERLRTQIKEGEVKGTKPVKVAILGRAKEERGEDEED